MTRVHLADPDRPRTQWGAHAALLTWCQQVSYAGHERTITDDPAEITCRACLARLDVDLSDELPQWRVRQAKGIARNAAVKRLCELHADEFELLRAEALPVAMAEAHRRDQLNRAGDLSA